MGRLLRTTNKPPVWLMRQAGRYLPEYRALRANSGSFLDACFTPKIAAEITLQPIRRFDFDGAVIFSDILVIPYAMGQGLTFDPGPILESLSVEELLDLEFNIEKLHPVLEAIGKVKSNLNGQTMIGFAGSPATIATYMLNGLKQQIDYNNKLSELITKLTDFVALWLQAQIDAGAEMVQIFDTWASLVPKHLQEEFILTPLQKILNTLNVPTVYYARNISYLYPNICQRMLKPDLIMGLDENLSAKDWDVLLPIDAACQGNLSSIILRDNPELIEAKVNECLEHFAKRKYIFNLGHGILPNTPIENVELMLKVLRQ